MIGRRRSRGRGWSRPAGRWLAPEVVQSSAMDCGPAALKCLLEGFGRQVSYERLRELCRTDLDGTSIDTLEQLAVELGLAAEQVMLPVDHLLVAEARAFPALLVVVSPIGATHFVVVWSRRGGWVQVMDPAYGRRWVPAAELLSRAYVHGLRVPAPAWRQWAASEEFLAVARARLRSLGIGPTAAEQLLEPALAEPGWRRLAALDAALRMASSLHRAAALRGGRDAAQLLAACCRRDQEAPDGTAIPLRYWSVRPAGDGGAGEELLLRGAVLVRVLGLESPETAAAEGRVAGESAPAAVRAAGLRARLLPARTGPVRSLFRMLAADGRLSLPLLLAALAVAAAAAVLEAMLLRGLLDVAAKLGRQDQRAAAAFALLTLFAIQLGLEVALVSRILSAGRRLEIRLRLRLLETIAGLSDRYFRSRLVSDLAERCHSAHRLRSLPEVASNFLRNVFQLVLTAGAIAWLDPAVAPLAGLAAALGLLLPIAAQPVLTERDMKVRSHVGALARVHLDGLLGLVPVRNHGAKRCLRREHEGLLVEWVRSALRLERAALDLDLLQSIAGYGLAVWLVIRHLGAAHHDLSQVLLLGYWALQLPQLAQQADVAARQYPLLRSTALRVMEPLRIEEGRTLDGDSGMAAAAAATASADEEEPVAGRGGRGRRGVGIRFERVAVTAAGHALLRDVDLEIEPGAQVAIVGPSGAGKSTLVGLLLGWHEPSAGRLLVDGAPLDSAAQARLRRRTAWVDPSIQLWNRQLDRNLLYGSAVPGTRLAPIVDTAILRPLLEALPLGLQTPLGEGGALVSGGEGQRVRLGRALVRREARLAILDEPFRGLDRDTRGVLLDRARAWWGGATLLCVTHDVAATLTFDLVAVLERGAVVEAGCPRQLADRPGSRYRALLDGEAATRARFRDGALWRRFDLAAGRLKEGAGRLEAGEDSGARDR